MDRRKRVYVTMTIKSQDCDAAFEVCLHVYTRMSWGIYFIALMMIIPVFTIIPLTVKTTAVRLISRLVNYLSSEKYLINQKQNVGLVFFLFFFRSKKNHLRNIYIFSTIFHEHDHFRLWFLWTTNFFVRQNVFIDRIKAASKSLWKV